jgi:hypothetical protein
MRKNLYTAPVLIIEQVEPESIIALSLDTSKAEWKDDVDFEVKELSGVDNAWEEIW